MIEMELMLNKKASLIKKAILYVGKEYKPWRLKELLDHSDLNELIITGCIEAKQAEEIINPLKLQASCMRRTIPEKLEFCPIEQLQPMNEDFALLFEGIEESSDILSLTKLQPTYLFGEIPEFGMSAFGIWEKFKACCRHIMIKTVRHCDEPQILDWEKDENNSIELSIIFPMYNVAKYLDQCIQSVCSWQAEYVEFLFVNDGSPDDSREIVLKYAQSDSRIKLLDKPNGGCASARQWGMDKAKGRYVGFVDPDDYIDESMFRKLLRSAMIGGYDISYCGYKEYYENTGETKEAMDVLGWPYNKGTADVNKIRELIAFARVAIWRGIYKMDMLKNNNIHFYTDLRRFDDLPFKVETFATAKSVITIEEYLYYYRLARPGQDVSADDERLYVHFPIFDYLNKSVASTKNARVIDYLQMCKIQTHRYALGKIKPEFAKEYMRQAKNDLLTTGKTLRTLLLAKKMLGNKGALCYCAIMNKNYFMFNKFNK